MKFFKRTDLLIICIILAIGLGTWGAYQLFFASQQAVAEIYYGDQLVKTVGLDSRQEQRFSIPQDEHVIFHLYPDGSICFESSDCPDKICIRSGRLSKAGQSAACLPNKIILKIVPKNGYREGDPDVVV